MTGLETILAFLTVMGIISVPFAAVITRRSSPIGQALADRIRRKTELREAAGRLVPGVPPEAPAGLLSARSASGEPAQLAVPLSMLEDQQREIQELTEKIDFLQRLIENQQDAGG